MRGTSTAARPFSPTIIALLFLPNGGLASTTPKRWPGSAASASATAMGTCLSEPMPCSSRFIAHTCAVALLPDPSRGRRLPGENAARRG